MDGDRVRVICGPTAAGKSAIATALALEYGGAIISADSRQIYRGFDIGTAKPDWSERKSVQYEGIDIAEPEERFSASRWALLAAGWIRSASAEGRVPIVVGGTGFYLRALFQPLFEAPALDPERRARLERILSAMPLAELRRWCHAIDPSRAHLGRAQLARVVEVALLAGERMSALHARPARRPDFRAVYLVVDPEARLADRIVSRIDSMLAAGWLDEVRALTAGVPDSAPAWLSSGYRTMRSVVRGELDLLTARQRIIIETRQYAKRQRTWLRHQLDGAPVTRVDPGDPACQALVQRWWKEST